MTLKWAVDGGSLSTGVSLSMTDTSGKRVKYKQKLPHIIGEHIRFQLLEATTNNFEIVSIEVNARVRTNVVGTIQ
jgi:hypothetical protein